MDIVETLAIRREGESAQVPAGEEIGQTLPSFDIEQLKSPRSLSPFLHLVQEQPTVGGNTKGLYRRVVAGSPFRGVDQKTILAVRAFTHVDAGLFLIREALPKEIAATGDLQGVIGFDGEELSNALTDALASGEIVQIGAGIAGLLFNPGARAGRILVFEPTVGIWHSNAVKKIRDHLDGGMRRRLHQLGHGTLRSTSPRASRSMRRVRLRR